MNLRPSGYEPDELPGCSTPRLVRACAGLGPAGAAGLGFQASPALGASAGTGAGAVGSSWEEHEGHEVWRRPTLPRLETQYHWRGGS